MSARCGERSDDNVCALDTGHDGAHCTGPDADGMVTGWGQRFPDDVIHVECPEHCGFGYGTTPDDATTIEHNADGSHTFTDDEGQRYTMNLAVLPPRHLHAV